jgi:phosphoribosylanthranilate isomerase
VSTKIKFCGFTNPEDVKEALKLPIDYLGCILNVAQSPRSVSLDQGMVLARLVKDRSDKKTVAVVKDLSEEMLEEILNSRVFDVIQWHGGEIPDFLAEQNDKIEIWSVIEFQEPSISELPSEEEIPELNENASTITPDGIFIPHKLLVDLPKKKHVDLSAKDRLLFFHQIKLSSLPIILAGKLNPENIKRKIKDYKPWSVDLASGIELKPGKKDPEKMHRFVQEVFKADSRPEEELWHGVCC